MIRYRYVKILICLMILATMISILTINSYAISYDDNNIMYSDKADDLLCTLSKRNYYKAYDGWALVAYYYCSTGYSGPILVSDVAENVAFTTTWDKKILTYGGTITYNGKLYYYSSTEYFMPGNLENTDTNKLYKCNNGNQISVQDAALELLDKYMICAGRYREHQDVREIVQQEATCTISGRKIKMCFTCNTELESNEISPIGHAYGAYIVDKESSCAESGVQHRECLNCGYNQSESIPLLDHHFGDWKVAKEATCGVEGQQERLCSECQKIENDKIPALTHVYGEWHSANVAKCGVKGTDERQCTLCGNTETRSVEALVHSYDEYRFVSGSKLIPPIIKERVCATCGNIDQISDWSYIWVTVLAAIAVIGVVIGSVGYIKAFRKK